MTVRKTYKVRLYPNKTQEAELVRILGACRYVYNHFLDRKKKHYEETKKTISYMLLSRELTKLRHETDWMKGIQLTPLGQSLRRLEISYSRFFKNTSRFPRFKSKKDGKQSFQKSRDWRIREKKIQIQNNLIIRFRGGLDINAKLGTLTISKQGDKWYASMTALVDVKQPKRYTKPVGIDVGLTTLATLSNGKKFENIRSQEKLQRKLTKAQRSLSKKQKGSKRREKARQVVGRVYGKIKNVRSNHIHQVSSAIVRRNPSLIAVEDLNVAGMMRNRRIARSFADASVSELLRQLKYKQAWRGGQFVEVNRFYPSSKTCSACEWIVETLPLSVRSWKCGNCGKNHNRDINAAKNILREALAHSARGGNVKPPSVVPVEARIGVKSNAKLIKQ